MTRTATTVEFTPASGPRRRVRYEPRADGGYWRIVDFHNGCRWVPEGREPVCDLVIETRDEVVV